MRSVSHHVTVNLTPDTLRQLQIICHHRAQSERVKTCSYARAVTGLIQEAASFLPMVDIPTNGHRRKKKRPQAA
jgi:hypothetical protein